MMAIFKPMGISPSGRVILHEVRDAPGEGGKLPPRRDYNIFVRFTVPIIGPLS